MIVTKITMRKKSWVNPALKALALTCAMVSMFSFRAAEWLSGIGTSLIVKRGMVFKVI